MFVDLPPAGSLYTKQDFIKQNPNTAQALTNAMVHTATAIANPMAKLTRRRKYWARSAGLQKPSRDWQRPSQ